MVMVTVIPRLCDLMVVCRKKKKKKKEREMK